MDISNKGLKLIQEFEGLKLTAYQDVIGIWTIGYGNTFYLDGNIVKKGDKVTKAQAEALLKATIKEFETKVESLVKAKLNQNQFDALVSFTYNVGPANLKKSTLLKKVNINPNDESIADEFIKWNRASGKVIDGLTRRRQAESDLYFSK